MNDQNAKWKYIGIGVVVALVAWWLYSNRERSELVDGIPDRFHGHWKIVPEAGWEEWELDGIVKLHVTKNKLRIVWHSTEDEEPYRSKTYPVMDVLMAHRNDASRGRCRIFYDKPSHADYRSRLIIEFRYYPTEKIRVIEVVPTGHDDDSVAEYAVGEFVRP